MKVIVTLHSPASAAGELASSTITHKGKALDINQLDNGGYVVTDDGAPIAVYPSGSVHYITLKGKKPEPQNGYGTPSLVDQIADGIAKAERLSDEKSQARWAVESNPVATAHPDFDTFLNSKMTSEDCAVFGVGVARTERDQYKARVLELEEALISLQADVAADDLPQAMQDRELLYARVTALQNRIASLDDGQLFGDHYYRGVFNGLLTAESIMTGEPAKLVEDPAVVEERRFKEQSMVDPKAFEAEDIAAGVPEVEFTDLDDNTPTVDKGGLKKK